jgi:hypothetical protein
MDHQIIDEQHIPERYLMGRLLSAEAEAFEQHFLSCETCTKRLETSDHFRQGIKTVAGEDAAKTALAQAGWLLQWAKLGPVVRYSMVAVLTMAIALPIVSNVQLRRELVDLVEPQINTVILNMSPQRSGSVEPSHQFKKPTTPTWVVFSLELDEVASPGYGVTLYDFQERQLWHSEGLQANASDALSITLPTSFLAAGDYALVVDGEESLIRYTFRVHE